MLYSIDMVLVASCHIVIAMLLASSLEEFHFDKAAQNAYSKHCTLAAIHDVAHEQLFNKTAHVLVTKQDGHIRKLLVTVLRSRDMHSQRRTS